MSIVIKFVRCYTFIYYSNDTGHLQAMRMLSEAPLSIKSPQTNEIPFDVTHPPPGNPRLEWASQKRPMALVALEQMDSPPYLFLIQTALKRLMPET